ncbi:MAG: PilN domain-containing protein [Kofleriaceae bacterium]|nr:PilN domain-containing protein [Kofleriaceae bacterium]MBP6839908.1 PilN domain-containing protein [Kofleriaceae bacterium]MBP9206504.1 PilN domain-containing protein [Kofleriaceae bacterium]
MIKINLLPQRKVKRAASTAAPTRDLWIGGAAVAAAAAAVVVLVHLPMRSKISGFDDENRELARDNAAKQRDLKEFPTLKAVVVAAKERSAAIEKLIQVKAVPAHLLQELTDILTPGRTPTMSDDMKDKVNPGPKGDPNKRFALDWDPKHVWITSLIEKDGGFILTGGAQSDPDVIQLAKRMQASVYFSDVSPQGGQRVTDKDSSITYFQFAITGKVVY